MVGRWGLPNIGRAKPSLVGQPEHLSIRCSKHESQSGARERERLVCTAREQFSRARRSAFRTNATQAGGQR